MGKVIVILVVLALVVGGVLFYSKNTKEIADYKQRNICLSEAKRVATTYEGERNERVYGMAYERCLKKHNLK